MSIEYLFEQLMLGNGSVVTSENILFLNNKAMELYQIPELDKDQIEILRKIILICNVLYNRSDMQILPIEDGFYDLLLEKYKRYDEHFQVGSAVIDFRNSIESDTTRNIKVAKCPISFFENQDKDEIHQDIYNEITRFGKPILNRNDFTKTLIRFDNDENHISKRTHNTQHNHPSLVGTLDKCKFVTNQDAIDAGVFNDDNVKIFERDFVQAHISKGIIKPNQEVEVVVELKYDGISVEADCDYRLQSARTRGDTGIGEAADITPILEGYRFNNARCMIGEEPVGIKFEAIMTKSNLETFNRLRNKNYANCRTAIVGLFGASDAYLFRDLITLIPLAVDREQFKYPLSNRLEEIEFLNRVFSTNGEPLRYCYFKGTIAEILYYIKAFWDEAKIARNYLNFMYDGIVVSYLDENIRSTLGRQNFINKYSVAIKFDPFEKQTIFRGYTYEVGQHGNITPMIHYDPVEFLGTIHTKSTGSSLKRFQDLNLKYGDYINVTYVNDVMPYVSRLDCDHNTNNPNPPVQIIKNCPVCGSNLDISESGKSLICPNNECPGRSLQRIVNTFSKLNLKGFADATFKSLNKTRLSELDEYNLDQLINILGDADGKAFYDAMNYLKSTPQKDFILMGSLGFTSMAYKKWQTILQFMTIKDMNDLYNSCCSLDEFRMTLRNMIPNIGDASCNTIANQWNFFQKDIVWILNNVNIQDSYGMQIEYKKQIRFTGVRNKQLCEQLNTLGYDADDGSITKNTDILLIPYEGFSSSKVQKAMKNPNTKIIPIQVFIDNMDKILSE